MRATPRSLSLSCVLGSKGTHVPRAAETLHNKGLHQMASLHRLLILTLLGAARAPPPGSSDDSGDACAADGSSASYSETISSAQGVEKRTIVSAGCPNHESYCTGKPGNSCGDEGKQTTLVEGKEQSLSVEVPANPKLKSSYTAEELDCSMGTVAYALNGVGSVSYTHLTLPTNREV